MTARLVIFDLDGTLVDSIGDLAEAAEYALKENGYPSNPKDNYRYYVGNGTMKLIERALPEGTDEAEICRIHKVFSERYREHCLDLTKPYDGIQSMLHKLKAAGIMIAVASNKPDEFAKTIVAELFGEGYFDSVHGKREGVPAKPAPDIVFSIMKELDVQAGDTIIAGDSDVDVATAHNAGTECIGCVWGFRGYDELKRAGAEYIAYKAEDISDIILEAAE